MLTLLDFFYPVELYLPIRLGSVTFNLTNVGSLIYLVSALAKDSGYVAETANICLLAGRDE